MGPIIISCGVVVGVTLDKFLPPATNIEAACFALIIIVLAFCAKDDKREVKGE